MKFEFALMAAKMTILKKKCDKAPVSGKVLSLIAHELLICHKWITEISCNEIVGRQKKLTFFVLSISKVLAYEQIIPT